MTATVSDRHSSTMAILCARKGGGLVFPPLWYGESREEGLMEANGAEREGIWAAMNLPASNFAPGYMRFPPHEQIENYVRLLMHCLFQVQSLGFKVLVIAAGIPVFYAFSRASLLSPGRDS